jgi:hypothetical protein
MFVYWDDRSGVQLPTGEVTRSYPFRYPANNVPVGNYGVKLLFDTSLSISGSGTQMVEVFNNAAYFYYRYANGD